MSELSVLQVEHLPQQEGGEYLPPSVLVSRPQPQIRVNLTDDGF